MIEAQELRIGNLIELPCFNGNGDNIVADVKYGVFACDVNCIRDAVNYGSDWAARPILITEEWLVKFGFRKHNSDRTYEKFPIQVHFGDDGRLYVTLEFDSTVTGSYSYDTDCEYVHQLQNLYYALMEEELTIKE